MDPRPWEGWWSGGMRDGSVLGTSLWVVQARTGCPFVVPFCGPRVCVCVCVCVCARMWMCTQLFSFSF